MIRTIFAIMAIALSACHPEPTVVIKPVQITLPPECISSDGKFPVLPDRDVTWKEAARDREHAEDVFDDVVEARSVCRSAIIEGRINIQPN